MIDVKQFFNDLILNEIDFFSGVPDSLLKDLCAYITDNTSKSNHIITANEGGAISLAMGYHLATGKTPLVYMQNSGLGNTVNPLLSLADSSVYSIPMLLLVGWRGEPGTKDEPQHYKQGLISEQILDTLQIPYFILPEDYKDSQIALRKVLKKIKETSSPCALLIRKNTFKPYNLKNSLSTSFSMNREDAIKKIIKNIELDDIVIATTGKTSRELFEYRKELNQTHERDFLTVGGMGHANQIALGIALQTKDRQVYCIDGDGAVLMHLGSVGIIGDISPLNFKHIIINNGSHDSVGGQPTVGFDINFKKIFKGLNYKNSFKITNSKEFQSIFNEFKNSEGPSILEILVNKGARKDLGRPTISPSENKIDFMNFLR
tara:strand:+ start:7037 stop:8161 length:1125 start_codon:yes stop_codon:yes gene_type:complete